jgi:hypothetical protein
LYCDDFLCVCICESCFSLNAFGNSLEPNTQKQRSLGAIPAENPRFGNPQALFKRKTLRIREETLPLGIPIMYASQSSLPMHSLSVNKIASRDALQIHSHIHPPLLIFSPAPKKTPKPWTRASNPRRTTPQRNARFESEFPFDLLLAFSRDLAFYLLFIFSFSLDLLP